MGHAGAMKFHPRSAAFAWQPPPGPFELLTEEQASTFSEDGGFVLEDAFDQKEVDALLELMDPLEAASEAALRGMEGGRAGIARADEIIFRPHLVARSEVLKVFSRHRIFQQLVAELIGPDVRLYWDQLVYKKPGTPHRTGPNCTHETRKAYILQYAPDHAVMYPRDGEAHPANDADWQYPILVLGRPPEQIA